MLVNGVLVDSVCEELVLDDTVVLSEVEEDD